MKRSDVSGVSASVPVAVTTGIASPKSAVTEDCDSAITGVACTFRTVTVTVAVAVPPRPSEIV